MKKLIVATFLLLSINVFADDIHVKVNGMVCSACSSKIEKAFKKQDAIKHVKVSLEKKLVYLTTKENHSFSNDMISNVIKDAGFIVVKIHRN